MNREALEVRRGELQKQQEKLTQAQLLIRGALLEVEEWLTKVTEAEKGAVAGATSAPLTPETRETETNGSTDESGSDSIHSAEDRLSV